MCVVFGVLAISWERELRAYDELSVVMLLMMKDG